MDNLPWQLRDEILFRTDLRSLAIMRCTSKPVNSHISNDTYFESEYFSRASSGLLHISSYNSAQLLCYNPMIDSRSRTTKVVTPIGFQVLGSCSGLLLLVFPRGLCVANPLTRKFRFIDHFRSGKFSTLRSKKIHTGFAVDRIQQTTRSFKIVCVMKTKESGETTYTFVINAKDSWRVSKTELTCPTSNLVRNPVYFDGSLHWLRNDGSIVAFDPKTEQARLISVVFPEKLSDKTLFAADGNGLALITATVEVIYIYALELRVDHSKWVLVRRIQNRVQSEKNPDFWNVVAYDGKCLVLRVDTSCDRVTHRYDLRTNEWEAMDSYPLFCDASRDFFLYTPSPSRVIGLDDKTKEEEKKQALMFDRDGGEHISSLGSIMSMFNGKRLIKGYAEEQDQKPPSMSLFVQSSNNRRREG